MHKGQHIRCDECPFAFPTFPTYTDLSNHKKLYHTPSNFPNQTFNALQLAALNSMRQPQSQDVAQILKKKEERVLDLSSPVKPMVTPQLSIDGPTRLSSQFTSIEQLTSNNDTNDINADENDHLIRDMKLKGEFPCRLCDAVFPNLRALKGHNKEHMDR